jgi:hypothetical protein
MNNLRSGKEIIMIVRKNTAVIYIMAVVIVVMLFFMLGGVAWMKGITNGNNAVSISNLHWGQILISLGLGFLIGWIVLRRKW